MKIFNLKILALLFLVSFFCGTAHASQETLGNIYASIEGVHSITFDELERMGIGPKNQLYWDGKEIQVKTKIVLGKLENRWAGIAAVSAGIMAFFSILTYFKPPSK